MNGVFSREWLIRKIAKRFPQLVMDMGYWANRYHQAQPDAMGRVEGFHDLVPLFTCHAATRGFVQLDLDEGAHLYRLALEAAKRSPAPRVLEIGRAKGGSTVILAAGIGPAGKVVSVDLTPPGDDYLRELLARTGLADRVELLVGDSRKMPLPEGLFDLVFIDGDHEYAGVKADWERVKTLVRPGAEVLFHDAGKGRELAQPCPGCAQLVAEIAASGATGWERRPDVGSLAQFRRVSQ